MASGRYRPFTGLGRMRTAGVPLLVLVPPSSSLASRPAPATLWSLKPRPLMAVTRAVAMSTVATALFSCSVT